MRSKAALPLSLPPSDKTLEADIAFRLGCSPLLLTS